MFRVSQRTDDQSLLRFSTRDPIAWVDSQQLGLGLAAGSIRREWIWLALVDDKPVARAVWWGPAGSVYPIELRCLIVASSLPHPELWGAAIIRSAHRAFAEAGALFVPEFVVTVDAGRRGDAAIERALAWRREAARQAGASMVVAATRASFVTS
ncbi:hypothetical protein [Subtercola lobariae]|uniref:GNAT family N-acetyltransferase n=1 Tax=Subtercola lobariae TaxID=1588641 RepID=A0A917B2A7_9MICO|nr:hypothetical protein [Subtercola lobariae]GGF18723.1 hypothetical protein GCM10011399_10450 [Subtercola lobariae]